MGTHLKVLSESYPVNTNLTGFRRFSNFVLWTKLASALEGPRISFLSFPVININTRFEIKFTSYWYLLSECLSLFLSNYSNLPYHLNVGI